jgi:lipoprotein NlpI
MKQPHAATDGGGATRSGGDPALALSRLDRLVALTPQPVADPYYQRGLAHPSLGDANLAIANFEAAIRGKPQMAAAHKDLGNLLRQRGDFAAAETVFARALRADPDHFEARHNRGLNALQSGNLTLAREALADCLRG